MVQIWFFKVKYCPQSKSIKLRIDGSVHENRRKMINAVEIFKSGKQPVDDIGSLLRSIFILEEQLLKPENQTFMFRKGIESNLKKLKRLKNEYEIIKTRFNNKSVQQLRDTIRGGEKKIEQIMTLPCIYSNHFIALNVINSGIAYDKELIKSKKRYVTLHSLEYLSNHTGELMKFFA